MNLTLIAALISAGVAGLAGWSAAWTLQGRTIDKLVLEQRDERIAKQWATRQTFERYSTAVSQAQEAAQRRNDRLDGDRIAAAQSAVGLRDTSTATVRASADSPAASSAAVSAYDIVFSECAAALQEMAVTLDRCTNDTQTLIQGWPK